MLLESSTETESVLRADEVETPDKPLDDHELVAAIAAGDEAACRELLRRHLTSILSVGRRMLRNPADAEEVAQETFLRLWRHAESWEPGRAAPKTWLYRVATNLCLDRLRRKRFESGEEPDEPVSEAPLPDAELESAELGRLMHQAVGRLPERQKAALTLVHFEGLTNIEAAAALEVSVEALESLLARARRKLKSDMAGYWQRGETDGKGGRT